MVMAASNKISAHILKVSVRRFSPFQSTNLNPEEDYQKKMAQKKSPGPPKNLWNDQKTAVLR